MQSKDIVKKNYECFARGDLPGVISLLSSDVRWNLVGPRSIPYFGEYNRQQGVEKFFSLLFQHEEILEFAPENFICEEDQVAVVGKERCRAKNTGKEFSASWVHIFKVKDDKIIGFTEYIDTHSMVEAYR